MALTLTEQITLRYDGLPNLVVAFDTVVFQAALVAAYRFQANEKEFDEMANPKALEYIGKVKRVLENIYKADQDTVNQLTNLMVVAIAEETTFTLTQIVNADKEAASTFIADNIFKVIERLALVYKSERQAYNLM